LIDAVTRRLGKLLVKAVGDEGDMLSWDKYRWTGEGKPPKVKISEFIENNPDKFNEYLYPNGQPRLIDMPLEMDYDLPVYADIRQDLPENLQQIAPMEFGHYGSPEKMAGPSVMDSTPLACIFADRDNPKMACGHCYACKGNYLYNNVQLGQWRNLDRMLTHPEAIAAAYSETLTPRAMLARERPTDDVVARGFSAGDARGPGAFAMLDQIARRNPMTTIWGSTRQIPYLYDFLEARGFEPDAIAPNLALQMSLPGKMLPEQVKPDSNLKVTSNVVPDRDVPIGFLSQLKGIDGKPMLGMTGYDKLPTDGETNICPATIPGNPKKCNKVFDPLTGNLKCRACYRRGAKTVYLDNTNALRQLPPSMRERALNEIFNQMRSDSVI